jgi:hypothetical protein
MSATGIKPERRQNDRMPAVVPVRVRGTDTAGVSFDDLAHTLDVTPTGVRLGAIRHQLKTLDTLTVFYRQRRMEFRVIWTKPLQGTTECQVGLQAMTQGREDWATNLFNSNLHRVKEARAASGAI